MENNMSSTFLAWITRMPLIKRWALMHTFREENVSEHSHQVAVIAHLLCTISNEFYGTKLNPEKAATTALFHEISETKLQDLNSKTKYQSPEFTKQFKMLEHLAETECINTLPAELQKYYTSLVVQTEVNPIYRKIVKAADILSAYLKTKEELRYNNAEFAKVEESFQEKIEELISVFPAVDYFMKNFAQSCNCTVDELSGIDANKKNVSDNSPQEQANSNKNPEAPQRNIISLK